MDDARDTLSGDELDAAVARLEGYAEHLEPIEHWFNANGRASTDWRVAGPIIERMTNEPYGKFRLTGSHYHGWHAVVQWPEGEVGPIFGETALIASMRAFVAAAEKKCEAPPEPLAEGGGPDVPF